MISAQKKHRNDAISFGEGCLRGSGKNAKIEGVSIGGKTATSQTLPRSDHKYISSFLGFAPADDPKVLVLVVINDPKGTYYGGQSRHLLPKKLWKTFYRILRNDEK